MKVGINAWVWIAPVTTESFAALVPKVAQMGFDWIEVPVDGLEDLDYRRAAEAIREQGLGCNVCVAIGPDRDLIHPDSAVRANGAAYVRHCIDAVHVLGGTNVVGPLYSAVGRLWQQTPDERARDLDLLVDQLTALSAYAYDKGAVLCLEPLNRFETSFVNLAAQAVEIVDRVDSPACKLLLDTFHMNIEEKSLGAAIRQAGTRLAHVHACENDRGAPGTGHVDWQDVAQALRDIQYQGPLVIESFTNQIKTIARGCHLAGL
jgi:D-psicose/D-tagatose/L-ribulose 3-epimerase